MRLRKLCGHEGSGHGLVTLAVVVLALCAVTPSQAIPLHRKKKEKHAVSPNDPTVQLFNLFNNSLGGKLSGLYLLADVYPNPANPAEQYQRVLSVTYDKSLFFGRLVIHVRSVDKLSPSQLAIYSPKQIFNFGGSDTEVFDRTQPGSFGDESGDLYLHSAASSPLASAPITDAVAEEYNMLVTKYILPAVRKRAGQS